MAKADFIKQVMQVMNEAGWNNDSFSGSDVTMIEEHIEAVFVDAWRKATKALPKTYFTINDFSGNKLSGDTSTGTGYIILPDDFYTLYSFKMEGWQKAVETLYPSSDSMAAIQANEYTRGSAVRPVCIMSKKYIKKASTSGEIKEAIEYYSLPKGKQHKVAEALYIPLMKPLSDDTVIDQKLITPLAYLCAGLVYNIFEKPDIAALLERTALEIN